MCVCVYMYVCIWKLFFEVWIFVLINQLQLLIQLDVPLSDRANLLKWLIVSVCRGSNR
jgi:hypothetical protein